MFFKKLKVLAATGFFTLSAGAAFAGTHTWIPTERTAQSGYTLPPVTVYGESINWGQGYFDNNDFSPSGMTESYSGGNSLGYAIESAKERAYDLSNVCKNPFVSQATRDVTGNSSVDSRYWAAVDTFQTIQMKNMWSMYGNATRITIIVDGKNYTGFNVTYADGARETWMVNPGHAMSSVKLFDQPLPGSLKAGEPGKGCNQG